MAVQIFEQERRVRQFAAAMGEAMASNGYPLDEQAKNIVLKMCYKTIEESSAYGKIPLNDVTGKACDSIGIKRSLESITDFLLMR